MVTSYALKNPKFYVKIFLIFKASYTIKEVEQDTRLQAPLVRQESDRHFIARSCLQKGTSNDGKLSKLD